MRRKLVKLLELASFYLYNRIMRLFFPLEKDKILFAAEARDELRGNLKAVYDALPNEVNKVVHLKGDRREKVSFSSKMKLFRDLTTARVIVLDDYFGLISAIKLRKNQEIIQLWHGEGAFKRFGFSRANEGENIRVHSGYRKYTKAVVTSEEIRWCYADAFDISKDKVWACGTPRSDLFFKEEERKKAYSKVKAAYPKIEGKKVVLIAPTYRGDRVEAADYAFEKLNLQELSAELGDEYIILLKWHPAVISNIRRGSCDYSKIEEAKAASDNILDVSDYNDINELLVATDILVTDYSSVIFDYYLLGRPIVYFAYDLEEYKEGRGLYFEFDEYVFGKVAEDYDELLSSIKDEDKCEAKREAFGRKFMSACDGRATERISEWIMEGTHL